MGKTEKAWIFDEVIKDKKKVSVFFPSTSYISESKKGFDYDSHTTRL